MEAPTFLIVFVFLIFGLVGLVGTVFWLWMIIDCAANEPEQGNTKIVWILILIFTHWVGALIYFLVRRPERIAEVGK